MNEIVVAVLAGIISIVVLHEAPAVSHAIYAKAVYASTGQINAMRVSFPATAIPARVSD